MAPLAPGDIIGIVAPSSPIPRGEFTRGVRALEALGFRTAHRQDVFSRDTGAGYLAGRDLGRAAAINAMFRDNTIAAVICARGGYGAARIIPHLDRDMIRRHPKPFIGYSDVTSLLLFLLQEGLCPVFHGPMISTLGGGLSPAARAQFVRTVTGILPLGTMRIPGGRVLRPGRARGRLTGGCLSLLISSLGTVWEAHTDGSLLFLEDRGEAPYRIDRMLTQLRQAGKLSGVRGIVFGRMPGCGSPRDLSAAILSGLGEFRGPVVMGFPSGHVEGRVFLTLPFGVAAELDAGDPSLSILDSPFS